MKFINSLLFSALRCRSQKSVQVFNNNTLQQCSNKSFTTHSLELLKLTIHKMYVLLCTLLFCITVCIFYIYLQRNIYLPVKCTARVVNYLTAKYPLIELAHTRKYIVNPKRHFVYALHHRSCDPWQFPTLGSRISHQ